MCNNKRQGGSHHFNNSNRKCHVCGLVIVLPIYVVGAMNLDIFLPNAQPPLFPTPPITNYSSYEAPSIWYFDTAATRHIAFDISSLSISVDYKGQDKLLIGNDHDLKIANIDASKLLTNSHSFNLNNMIYVLTYQKVCFSFINL